MFKCNQEKMSELIENAFALPRKLYLASLGFVGMLPELVTETVPRRTSDTLADSENLYNHAVERGEIILEKRQK